MRSYIITRFHRLNDLRFASLSAEAERTYDRLRMLAGVIDADGLFIENGKILTYEEIAYRIRLQTQTTTKAIKELQKAGILHVNGKGPQIIDWKHEQIDLNAKREKDRTRQQRHRGVTRDTDVTERDEGLSQSVTDIERETQTKTKTLLSLLSDHRKILEEQHPEWIPEAIQIATANGKHSDKYIAGIVRNWILEGRTPKGIKKYGNPSPGTTKRTVKPQPAQANYSASDRAIAERALAKRNKSNV